MAKPISGLQPVVSQLRDERTNLVNQLRHVDAALSVLGKLEGVHCPQQDALASQRQRLQGGLNFGDQKLCRSNSWLSKGALTDCQANTYVLQYEKGKIAD